MHRSNQVQMIHTTIRPTVNPGRSSPLGATIRDGGANFSVFSRNATAIELLFFDTEDDPRPSSVIPLDPSTSRSYHYWHAFVPEIRPGQLYGYRVDGRFDPASGRRFDPSKVLLDPYGRGVVVPPGYSREAARRPGDNCATAMKSVVVDASPKTEFEPIPSRRQQGVAWRETSPTRLEPAIAQPGIQCGIAGREPVFLLHPQRLLGTARIPVAGRKPHRRPALAPMD